MKRFLSIALCLALTGCEMLAQQPQPEPKANTSTTQIDYAALLQEQQNQAQQVNTNDRLFVPYQHHKTLVNYVEQMALELVDTMQQEAELGIAITTFVELDASLDTSSQLGNQIAESMMYQLQKFGFGVVDFKAMDVIKVTPRGDFVMTRKVEELAERQIASHVLSGTLIYRNTGVEVNARVINLNSKQVTASAQKVIPYFVLQNESIQTASIK
ncbi:MULTISPECIES: FlgO family outer membrane protein [Pseudoalteromonas]|uniref:FlgO family outer membrane protein n=1 Tax=Pseudoalteromonas TaxID=53246 RepID=UPI00078664E9|nr:MULTISPECIES: FlgO family outer membrane protein [Gammaproteobacteria]MCF7498514.1 flagellar biosynthesis protein FlgO [Pseudoalteromonas sp. L1]MCF7517041.1 flagellar biosynthesis protein FlgO [Pseudoalteromonas sp. L21]UJX24711.1 flagellar biosynthesis protein FlgO [Pseudoalteromonas sp. CF6-2]|tara:strand:+ start:260 stop:901 length:642 start_codon:yes stop_codon:yes gene_type:complete